MGSDPQPANWGCAFREVAACGPGCCLGCPVGRFSSYTITACVFAGVVSYVFHFVGYIYETNERATVLRAFGVVRVIASVNGL